MDADSGMIEVLGDTSMQGGRSRTTLERIGASIDGPAIYGHLSAFDNMLVHARLTGVGRARIEEVLDIMGLASTGQKRARHFSMGMKARLALGIAILTEPDLLILDDPRTAAAPTPARSVRYAPSCAPAP